MADNNSDQCDPWTMSSTTSIRVLVQQTLGMEPPQIEGSLASVTYLPTKESDDERRQGLLLIRDEIDRRLAEIDGNG